MNSLMTSAAVSLLCMETLASCGDSGGGRVKAVPAAMEASARKPTLAVPDNDYCGHLYAKTVGRRELDPDNYKGIAQVSVTPILTTDIMGSHKCWHFAWDKSVRFNVFGTGGDRAILMALIG